MGSERYTMQHTDLLRRADELRRRSLDRAIVTHTNFLTPAEQHVLLQMPHLRPALHLSGGGAEAERCVAFFLPDYLSSADFDPGDYLTAFHVRCRFVRPRHRDVLGSLLGLGLARWSVGDIHTVGEEAWFFCLPSVAGHISAELTKIGRNGAQVQEIPLDLVPAPERVREEVSFTVSGLRLDAVLAGTFHLSRTQAAELIAAGAVQLNYALCEKPAATVTPGDVFSLRGYGKACLREAGGKTRKDRTRVVVDRYV